MASVRAFGRCVGACLLFESLSWLERYDSIAVRGALRFGFPGPLGAMSAWVAAGPRGDLAADAALCGMFAGTALLLLLGSVRAGGAVGALVGPAVFDGVEVDML